MTEDELDSTIDDIVTQILKNGPVAVSQAKALVQQVANAPINAKLLDDTSKQIAKIRTSKEGQEGLGAFIEKRAPAWQEKQA